MPLISETIHVLNQYLLLRDLKPLTESYYRRCLNRFAAWCEQAGEIEFSAASASRYLSHLQKIGRSSHYRASVRNAIRAILRSTGNRDPIRQIRVERLNPQSWTPAEVDSLIAACKSFSPVARDYWQTIIAAAWYSGLSQIDLHRIHRDDIAADGTLEIARSKTGKIAFVQIPPEVLAQVRPHPDGRLWPLLTSAEWFRRTFAKIVTAAGLSGSFKKLRKSSGTEAEIISPGRGHIHLANSRAVFESNYFDRRRLLRTPAAIPLLTTHKVAHVAESLH